jgi:hypothetical protein
LSRNYHAIDLIAHFEFGAIIALKKDEKVIFYSQKCRCPLSSMDHEPELT